MKLFVNIIDSISDAVKWFYLYIANGFACLTISHTNLSSTLKLHCKMEMNESERARVTPIAMYTYQTKTHGTK